MEMPSNCCDEIVADDGSGRVICEFPYGLDANSAFIVRAVNAHDELVAALRPFASLLRHFDGRALSRPKKGPIHSWSSGDVDGGEPEALTVEMLRAAAAALAKATGEGA
jgi:hypothetical protein